VRWARALCACGSKFKLAFTPGLAALPPEFTPLFRHLPFTPRPISFYPDKDTLKAYLAAGCHREVL
jgi:hypothetical protein